MRSCSDKNNSVLVDDNGSIYGIFLAADHCAEHEMGIDYLKRSFGMPIHRQPFEGLKIMRQLEPAVHIEKVSDQINVFDNGKRRQVTMIGSFLTTEIRALEHAKSCTRPYDDRQGLTGAYGDRSFAVRGYGVEAHAAIEMIAEGFAQIDIAIWIGTNPNPFGRGGLIITRASKTPAALIERIDAEFHDTQKLLAASEATGIIKRVEQGIKTPYRVPYHALHPQWMFSTREGESAHPVIYFLNPVDQTDNNFGWFTVEQLDQ